MQPLEHLQLEQLVRLDNQIKESKQDQQLQGYKLTQKLKQQQVPFLSQS